MNKKFKRKHAVVDISNCVACGVCERNCPIGAISIYKGLYSKVDLQKCVGCSKCFKLCPASIITMEDNE